jgi:hypothetical protein
MNKKQNLANPPKAKDANQQTSLRRLATLVLFLFLQPVLYVFFGLYTILFAYFLVILVACLFGLASTRKIESLWNFPLELAASNLGSCAQATGALFKAKRAQT